MVKTSQLSLNNKIIPVSTQSLRKLTKPSEDAIFYRRRYGSSLHSQCVNHITATLVKFMNINEQIHR